MKRLLLLCVTFAFAFSGCSEFEEPEKITQEPESIASAPQTRAGATRSY